MDSTVLDELLRRARRREPEALRRLVETYSPRVFGLLYRLTGSRDEAEDLLQETFLRVVRVIDKYRHVGKFEAWLFRIAANLARDRARRRARRGETDGLGELQPLGAARAPGVQSDTLDPVQRLALSEAKEQLAEHLLRLSDAEREVILLRHYSGLSFAEIAAVLGVPLGTALARAHRGLERLRRELRQGE